MEINKLEQIKLEMEMEIEKSYRKGFHHGFNVGRNETDVVNDEVREWRYSQEDKVIGAPGTPFSGKVFLDLGSDMNKISEDGLEYLEYLKKKHQDCKI